MDPDFAQRRRLAVALAITVIAVPAVVLLNRGADDVATDTPTVTLVGTVPTPGATPAPAAPAGDAADQPAGSAGTADVLGSVPAAYLDGTAPPSDRPPAQIAVPRLPRSTSGLATFRRDIDDIKTCKVQNVPFRATVTVTNLDNSRSVQCIASIGGAQARQEVVLSEEAFLQIADLTDAPVPVRVTW